VITFHRCKIGTTCFYGLGKIIRSEEEILDAMQSNDDVLEFTRKGTVNVSSLRVLFDNIAPKIERKKDEVLCANLPNGLQQLASQVAYIEGLPETEQEDLLIALDSQLLASIDTLLQALGFPTGRRRGLQTIWLPLLCERFDGSVEKCYVPMSPGASPGDVWLESTDDSVACPIQPSAEAEEDDGREHSLSSSGFQLRKAVVELFFRASSLLGTVQSQANWNALRQAMPQKIIDTLRRKEAKSFRLVHTEPQRFLHLSNAQLVNGKCLVLWCRFIFIFIFIFTN
jgi:hypothetical protein